MQRNNFSKNDLKFLNFYFRIIASFSCKGCQTLLLDMRIIILLLIMQEE